jgi:hypothetical protein
MHVVIIPVKPPGAPAGRKDPASNLEPIIGHTIKANSPKGEDAKPWI